MTKPKVTPITKNELKAEATKAFTVKIEFVCQVFAADEKTALQRIDENAGYVTSRKVEILAATPLG